MKLSEQARALLKRLDEPTYRDIITYPELAEVLRAAIPVLEASEAAPTPCNHKFLNRLEFEMAMTEPTPRQLAIAQMAASLYTSLGAIAYTVSYQREQRIEYSVSLAESILSEVLKREGAAA